MSSTKLRQDMLNRFEQKARDHACDTGEYDFEPGDLLMILEHAMEMLDNDQLRRLEEYANEEVFSNFGDEEEDEEDE